MVSIVWELLIGLGIFLYGMALLEAGIGALSGARLRRWLARSTAGPLSSAGFGTLVTTILQSSSMVSLLVLAFASAGLMPLYNAIGVLIGANLGTTISGWVVATLGFKLDLAKLALPLLGIGGLMQVLNPSPRRGYAWGKAAAGLGLLLFGLTLMKSSVGDLPQRWDISVLQGYHPVIYLLAGLLITALIQSSSATVMLTLTALHADLISLSEAGALVIGADLGTTGTTLLASLTGPGIKRQLALAQLIFNIVVDVMAFVLLLPLLPWAVQWLGINDPLYSVVAFHTTFNLLGLIGFLPLLKLFSRWIEHFFQSPVDKLAALAAIVTPIPEATLPAMANALQNLWLLAASNTLRLMDIAAPKLAIDSAQQQRLAAAAAIMDSDASHLQVYEQIKHQEATLFHLAYKLQQVRLDEQQSLHLGQMQELARSIVYASKTLQDIAGDIQQLRSAQRAADSAASWQLARQQQFLGELYSGMLPLVIDRHDGNYLREQIEHLHKHNDLHFEAMNEGVYQRAATPSGDGPGLSIRLNVNREILHATRNLLHSIELWQQVVSGSGDRP